MIARRMSETSLSFGSKKRTKFLFKAYGLWIIFIIVAVVQWSLVSVYEDLRKFLHEQLGAALLSFVLAGMTMILFCLERQVRWKLILNWILAFIIVEGYIIGTAIIVTYAQLSNILTLMVMVAFIIIFVVLIGSFLPYDITLDVPIILIGMFMIMSLFTLFILLYAFLKFKILYYFYAFLHMCIMSVLIVYFVQCMVGGNYVEIPSRDHLLAAVILFHGYLIIFLVLFFIIK